ncbi:MAG: hypothetical protein QXF17_02605 [Ignisphaera sp.]
MESGYYEDFIERLNTLSSIIASFSTQLTNIDITSLASRYYISIHDVVLPIAIEDEKNLTSKTFFEPVFNIYLYENRAYAILKNVKELHSSDNMQWNKVPVIDLTHNEDFLAIIAASIAEKMHLSPSEKNIVKILPSSLRAYVDTAYNMVRRIRIDHHDISLKAQKAVPTRKPIEIILWYKKMPSDSIKEVAYIKGVSLRAVKVTFTDCEIEIKMYRSEVSFELLKLLEKVITANILTSISKNIERVSRILFTAISIIN